MGLGLAVMKDGSPSAAPRLGRLPRGWAGDRDRAGTPADDRRVPGDCRDSPLLRSCGLDDRAADLGPEIGCPDDPAGAQSLPIPAALTLALVRRSLDERLWGVRRSARLGLKSWLLRLLVSVLPLRRRGEPIRQPAKIAVIIQVVVVLSRRTLLTALRERLSGLRGGDKPK